MRCHSPARIPVNVLRRRRRHDASLRLQGAEFPVQRVEESLSVDILLVLLPRIFPIEDHRQQAIRIAGARHQEEYSLDEIFRGCFRIEFLVRKTNPIREFRVTEDKRHPAALAVREPVRRGVRHAGRIRMGEDLHVARRPDDAVLPEDPQNRLRNCPFARPHPLRRPPKDFPVHCHALCNLCVGIRRIGETGRKRVVRLAHPGKIRIIHERKDRMAVWGRDDLDLSFPRLRRKGEQPMDGNDVRHHLVRLRHHADTIVLGDVLLQVKSRIRRKGNLIAEIAHRAVFEGNRSPQKIRIKMRQVEPELDLPHLLLAVEIVPRVFCLSKAVTQRLVFREAPDLHVADAEGVPRIAIQQVLVFACERPGRLQCKIYPRVGLSLPLPPESADINRVFLRIDVRPQARKIVFTQLEKERRREIERTMDIRILLEDGRHVIVILRGMRPHPGTRELVRFGIDVQGLVLVPDDVQVEGLGGASALNDRGTETEHSHNDCSRVPEDVPRSLHPTSARSFS